MSVETSAVQISVNVTDNTSAQVLSGVEQNLNKMGGAGMRSGAQIEAGMQQAGRGMLSATEKTRLAAEEMGVRLPRAMITLIGQSQIAQAVLSKLSTVMIGFATIQIGAMVFEAGIRGAEKLWHNVLNMNQAVEDYNAKVAKTKKEDFGNTHSIETTTLRIDEATAALKAYQTQADELKQRAASQSTSLIGTFMPGFDSIRSIHSSWWAHDAQSDAMEQQKLVDQLKKAQQEQLHEQRIGTIELEHAYDWRLGKEKEITEERRKQHEIDAENAGYAAQQEGRLGNRVGTPRRGMGIFATKGEITPLFSEGAPGSSTQATNDALADAKANKALADLNGKGGGSSDAKSKAQELARIHEQALESGLRGSKLYEAQEAYAIKELKDKGVTSANALDDVHQKFHNEQMRRLAEQGQRTEEIERQASTAGLTGLSRTAVEGSNRILGVHDNQFDDVDAKGHSAMADRQRAAFAREANARGTEEQQRATEEAANKAAELAAKHKRSIEETEKIEAQARVHSLRDEKQRYAAIDAELQEKLAHYKEELAGQSDADAQYHRRAIAAEQEANAERIQASTEARKKMAGEFTSMFEEMNHPLKMLEKLGNKAAGEAAASMVQRAQQHFQGGKGGAGADAKGGAGGIFGDVLGGFGKKGKTPGAGAHAGAEIPGVHTAADQSFSIASATIYVGSATITGAGSGAGAGYSPGSSTAAGTSYGPGSSTAAGNAGISVPGSTALMSPGSVGGASASADKAASGITGMTNVGGSVASATGTHELGHALGDVNQGVGLTRQLIKNFKGSDSGNAGAADSAKGDDGSGGPSGMDRASGIVKGGVGLWAAHEGGGGVGGGLKGAASGAEMGLMIGGPIGAVVGAAAGAIIGGIGSGKSAREYDLKTVRPRIANDLEAYHSGGMNYLAAYSDAQSLQNEADQTTKKMGPADSRYFGSTILPEIKQLYGKLDAEQRAGRSMYSTAVAQYARGTDYVPETGMYKLHEGEGVFDSNRNERVTQAIESSSRMPVQSTSMGDMHIHLHANDAKSGAQFLMDNMHVIRAAVNQSLSENSGGGL
jgi:hypothetical protein